jgi:hypothetical protein
MQSGAPGTHTSLRAPACRRDGRNLALLMRELAKLEGLHWIRILYAVSRRPGSSHWCPTALGFDPAISRTTCLDTCQALSHGMICV